MKDPQYFQSTAIIDLDGGVDLVILGCETEDGRFCGWRDMHFEIDGVQVPISRTAQEKIGNTERMVNLIEEYQAEEYQAKQVDYADYLDSVR